MNNIKPNRVYVVNCWGTERVVGTISNDRYPDEDGVTRDNWRCDDGWVHPASHFLREATPSQDAAKRAEWATSEHRWSEYTAWCRARGMEP